MGCDTICDLPDSLLTQILLNLPTKDSVKTSVLSTRWRNLWLSVPGLDVVTHHFGCTEVFESFMDRFMEFNQGSCLQNFKIWYATFDGYRDRPLMELIGTVVDRGIQHLHVSMYLRDRDAFMHQKIYKSKTLVSLKLDNVELKNPESVVSLPCLKIMKLLKVCKSKDGPSVVEKLISGCPILEDLQLIRPFHISNKVEMFLRVSSQTPKRCCLGFAISSSGKEFTVEIDAPGLEYMILLQNQPDRIVVKNLSFLFKVEFNFKFDTHLQPELLRKRDIFCDFLTGKSSVRYMFLSQWTLEEHYCDSKLAPIPQFHNLYHLDALFFNSSLRLLPSFLESCPNLKILSFSHFLFQGSLTRKIDFTNVPRCLISTLEYVEIRKWMSKDETEIKLVNYFLENSAVLKKLTLSFKGPSITNQEAESYMKLLTSTKLSPTCEVIIG